MQSTADTGILSETPVLEEHRADSIYRENVRDISGGGAFFRPVEVG